MADAADLKPVEKRATKSPQTKLVNNLTEDNASADEADLAFCLALLREKQPDLACVIKTWPDLSESMKAGIVAMVTAAAE